MANWIWPDIIGGGTGAEEHPSATIDVVNGTGYFPTMGPPLHYIIHPSVSLSFTHLDSTIDPSAVNNRQPKTNDTRKKKLTGHFFIQPIIFLFLSSER